MNNEILIDKLLNRERLLVRLPPLKIWFNNSIFFAIWVVSIDLRFFTVMSGDMSMSATPALQFVSRTSFDEVKMLEKSKVGQRWLEKYNTLKK